MQRSSGGRSARLGVHLSWLFAVISVTTFAGWFFYQLGQKAQPEKAVTALTRRNSEQDVERLKAAVQNLERESRSIRAAIAAPPEVTAELPTTSSPESAPKGLSPDIGATREAQRVQLEAEVARSGGDSRDRIQVEEVLTQQLQSAVGSSAKILNVRCGTKVCKAIVEEDTALGAELNTSELVAATPLLLNEATFYYERLGSVKHTLVYAAREGERLPPQP